MTLVFRPGSHMAGPPRSWEREMGAGNEEPSAMEGSGQDCPKSRRRYWLEEDR